MHDLGVLPEIEQEVLAAPGNALQSAALQPARQVGRHRPAQMRVADGHAMQSVAGERGRQSQTGGFDFGQFGHGRDFIALFQGCGMNLACRGLSKA